LRSVRYIESRAMRRAAVGDDLRRDGRDLVGAPAVDDDLSARLRQPSASARPMPPDDPVTKAMRPLRPNRRSRLDGTKSPRVRGAAR